jgi:putative lipoic acid-binding regulatory protein
MSEETLLEFPCQFPIKAMGKADIEFDLLVLEIVQQHAVVPEKTKMTSRPSQNGKYLAVTVHIEAHSKEQLDNIYRQLSSHPKVLMAL